MYTKKTKPFTKKCIRDEQAREKSCYTNDLHEALILKDGRDFWKVWNSKFERKSANIKQVNGIADDALYCLWFCTPF